MGIMNKKNKGTLLKIESFLGEERSKTYSSIAETYRRSERDLYPWMFIERAKLRGAAECLEKMARMWREPQQK